MAEPTLETRLKLLKHAGDMEQAWITRIITVNGALISAVGAIIAIQGEITGQLIVPLYGIAILGFLTTVILTAILLRQHAWIRKHICLIKRYQDNSAPLIVPPDGGGMSIHVAAWIMGAVLVILWLGFALWLTTMLACWKL